MATTPFETASLVNGRAEARRRASAERARTISARLPAAASLLKKAGASKVWLFGSLATGAFDLESDVDLAAQDLPRSDYFNALAELRTLLGCPVDLVRIEEAPAPLAERVLTDGKPL